MPRVESVESSSSDANPQERRARRKEIMAEKRAHKRKGSSSDSRATKAHKPSPAASTTVPTPTPMDIDEPATKKRPVLLAAKPNKFPSKATTAASALSRRRSTVRSKQSLRREVRPLSSLQRQKVDTAFEKLFGYQWGTEFAFEQKDKDDGAAAVTPRVRLLLRRMLGARSAARLLRLEASGETMAAVRQAQAAATTKRATVWPATLHTPPTVATATSITKAASSSESPARAAPASTAAAAGSGGGGVDDLLQKMNETSKVSTISRTANDWESFKTDNAGLGASLEEHTESKGAFLKKKDFLERVDQRKFAHERNDRERNRLKNSKK